jgi:hypothetical protein
VGRWRLHGNGMITASSSLCTLGLAVIIPRGRAPHSPERLNGERPAAGRSMTLTPLNHSLAAENEVHPGSSAGIVTGEPMGMLKRVTITTAGSALTTTARCTWSATSVYTAPGA